MPPVISDFLVVSAFLASFSALFLAVLANRRWSTRDRRRSNAVDSGGQDPTAMRNIAIVRYDAFADVGGRLSYSVALLDDTRTGLVLTTLAGKSDVRTYVRAISAGVGDVRLTSEEQQAVESAANGTGSPQ